MAFMIPETVRLSAPEAVQNAFTLFRKALPAHFTIWHEDALELDADSRPPFVAAAHDIGIVLLMPLAWQLHDLQPEIKEFWQRDGSPVLTPKQRQEVSDSQQRVENLRRLLCASKLAPLVGSGGGLRPALHVVFVLLEHTAADVNRLLLRKICDDALVLAADELSQLYPILQQYTPPERHFDEAAFNALRLVISPGVEVHRPGNNSPGVILEGDLDFDTAATRRSAHTLPLTLDLQQEQIVKSYADIPPDDRGIARDPDTRLVRGVVGSGKSLILLHRARFLSQCNSDWRILVLTYNRSLRSFLDGRFRALPSSPEGIEIANFHAWCYRFLDDADLWPRSVLDDTSRRGLLANLIANSPQFSNIPDRDYVLQEFDWIRDQLITDWEQYANAVRRGRERRLGAVQRRVIWLLLEQYQEKMKRDHQCDWPQVALMMLAAMREGRIPTKVYHAILVDEAQDFAPSWFAVVQKMLKPETNMLFLVADAAQKIYRRSTSWRSLAIDVSGKRSRVLTRSYRNTFDILQVAYRLVADDAVVREQIEQEGDVMISPELDVRNMRRGPLPVIMQFETPERELFHIAEEISQLVQGGCDLGDIAIIHRDWKWLTEASSYLTAHGIPAQLIKGYHVNLQSADVKLTTLHGSKGLEFSAVFAAGVERLQPAAGLTAEELAEVVAEERRLLYVGFTRARDRLYISHTGSMPLWLSAALTVLEPNT